MCLVSEEDLRNFGGSEVHVQPSLYTLDNRGELSKADSWVSSAIQDTESSDCENLTLKIATAISSANFENSRFLPTLYSSPASAEQKTGLEKGLFETFGKTQREKAEKIHKYLEKQGLAVKEKNEAVFGAKNNKNSNIVDILKGLSANQKPKIGKEHEEFGAFPKEI